ncbi:MAG: hypothetical protein V3V22_01520 [Methylococcales bacterium]
MLFVPIKGFFDINRFFVDFRAPANRKSTTVNDETQNIKYLVMAILLCGSLMLSVNSFALGVEGYHSYRQTENMRDDYKKEALRFAESAFEQAKIGCSDETIDLAMQARENSRLVISDFTGATSQKIHIKLRMAVSAVKNGQMDDAAKYLQEAVVYLRKIQ